MTVNAAINVLYRASCICCCSSYSVPTCQVTVVPDVYLLLICCHILTC